MKKHLHSSFAVLVCFTLFAAMSTGCKKDAEEPEPEPTPEPEVAETAPEETEGVAIEPKIGGQLPMDVTFVDEVTDARNEKYLRRTMAELADEMGKAPADVMLDLALSEDLKVKFRWENKTPEWAATVARRRAACARTTPTW